MKKLILVKHAKPEIVPEKPPKEWKLAEEGRRGARDLAAKLSPYGLSTVVSSSEAKAIETAQIVAAHLGIPTDARPDLHEHDRTKAGFLSAEAFNQSVRAFFSRPTELVYGAETAAQCQARYGAAIERLLAEFADSIGIVSHGTVMTVFLAKYNPIDPFVFWRGLGLGDFVVLGVPDFEIEQVISAS